MAERLRHLVLWLALTAVVVVSISMGPADAQVPALPSPFGEPPQQEEEPQYPPLPSDSGHGRRVVYSVSEQRMWIVESDEQVSGSWLVSGRRGIPRPGDYSIFSRSRWSSANGGQVRME